MAKKKTTTTKPMSLFDPSAMGQGFNMAFQAEMANVPKSMQEMNQAMVVNQAATLSSQVAQFADYLKTKKAEEEEAEGEVKKRADKLINLNLGQAYYDGVAVYLDELEKEYKEKDLGNKIGSKEERNWNQRYNRLISSTDANNKNLTLAATMVAKNQHVKGGISFEDSKFLIGVADLHLGESTDGITARQEVEKDGGVNYVVTFTNKKNEIVTVRKNEHELANIIGTRQNVAVSSSMQEIVNDITTNSSNSKDKTLQNTDRIVNTIERTVNENEDPLGAYTTLIHSKYGNQTTSFVDEMNDLKSPLFQVIFEQLSKDPDLVDKFDKQTEGEGSGELDEKDFEGVNKDQLVELQNMIKNDYNVGIKLYSAWFTATEGENAFQVGVNNRQVDTPPNVQLTEAMTIAKNTTLMMNNANALPPVANVNGFSYYKSVLTKELVNKMGLNSKQISDAGGIGASIYQIEYNAGTTNAFYKFFTPYEMTLLPKAGQSFTDLFTGPKTTISQFSLLSSEYNK